MRRLRASDVTFTIECLPEELAIKGNAMASGDDSDHEAERWLRALRRAYGALQ